ncbi:MAG: class I SAM-dependent methyltransferase [Flavobacteriales bacterium]
MNTPQPPTTDVAARDQEKFYTVYRGRQSALYHFAYMRSAKVKAARLLLERNGRPLKDLAVLDYGFGTGTFLRACDPSCRIAGVEIDPVSVEAVRQMLARRGHDVSDVGILDVERWKDHPLLATDRRYDVILLSHVLEHLDDPVGVLQRLSQNLAPDGMIEGLLPMNELTPDENHKWVCDRALVERWAAEGGFTLVDYVELDHYVYYALPVLQSQGRIGRLFAQGISLTLGLSQAIFSPRIWFGMGKALRIIGAKPGQIVFLLKLNGR